MHWNKKKGVWGKKSMPIFENHCGITYEGKPEVETWCYALLFIFVLINVANLTRFIAQKRTPESIIQGVWLLFGSGIWTLACKNCRGLNLVAIYVLIFTFLGVGYIVVRDYRNSNCSIGCNNGICSKDGESCSCQYGWQGTRCNIQSN